MKHLSWKYIAGLVDGEGCFDFQIGHSKGGDYLTPRLRVTLVESCKYLLDLIQNQCQGSVRTDKRGEQNPNWQNVTTWQIENSRLRNTLVAIVPFLIIKKEQAKLLLWIIDHLKGKTVLSNPEIGVATQVAREEMKAMKRDPQRLSEKAIEKIQIYLN